MADQEEFCDCPEDGTAAGYGNSVRWLTNQGKFVCGRTGKTPRPGAHAKMIRDAEPYMRVWGDNRRVGRRVASLARSLGEAARRRMDEDARRAFGAN